MRILLKKLLNRMIIDHKKVVYVIALILITSAIFLPSLKNGFVNCDDIAVVVDNDQIKSLSFSNLKTIFTEPSYGMYLPLVSLSYALEYKVFKLNPSGYHLTSLFFHLINCVLVFWLIFLISGNLNISFVTALLFGIHPMHVESVSWIAERKDTLYSIFFLGSIISYLYYGLKARYLYYVLSIILFALSLFSKVMAVSLPFVLLIFDYLMKRKDIKKIILEKMPFLALSIIFAFIAFSVHYGSGGPHLKRDWILNIKYAFFGVIFYIYKMILPLKLCFEYNYRAESFTGTTFISIFPFFAVIWLFLLAIYSAKYSRKIMFGFLLYLITIFPIIQLIPSGINCPCDRYTYIPFIGLFYIIAEGFEYLKQKYDRVIINMHLVLIIAVLAFLSFQRTKIWKNSFSLWKSVLVVYPNSPRGLTGLGNAFNEQGKYKDALIEYSKALKIRPDYIDAYNNRGNLYSNLKDYTNAEKDFNAGIMVAKNNFMLFYNRGLVYARTNRYSRAIKDYSRAIELNPKDAKFYNNRGTAFARLNKLQFAIKDFQTALKVNPHLDAAYTNLRHALYLVNLKRKK